jgi:spore coat protein U-like protein
MKHAAHWGQHAARALALLLATACLPAAADCIADESGGNLGAQPSQRVRAGPATTTTATFRLGCGTSMVSVLGNPSLQAKITSPTTALTLKHTSDPTVTVPYAIAPLDGGLFTTGLLIINLNGLQAVGLLSASHASIAIQISTLPGANVPAGTYTDNIVVNWTYANICEGIAVINGCIGNLRNGNVDRTVTVQLEVQSDCTITAPNVQFGAAPVPSGFASISQSISLLCTRGMVFSVGLSEGMNASGGRRQMASGAHRLQYNLFKPDLGPWGNLGTARVTAPVAADGLTWQTLPYTARVYTDQPNVPVGSYSDTITVDVQY